MDNAQVIDKTDTTEIQPVPPESGKFTGEYARMMSQKAILARKQKQGEIKQKLSFLTGAETSVAVTGAADDFRVQRLARVREQLAKLDAQMAQEDDPQRLDRLASAQAKLSVQEFNLAGRPLPGSHRPAASRSRAAAPSLEPI